MFIFNNTAIFRMIVLILIVSFTGCVTSKIEYVESSEFPSGKTYRISEVFLNDGTVLILKDKEPEFKIRYKGNDNVILYYEDVNIERTILLKDVSRLKIEVLESNIVVNVIIIVSSIILFFLLIFWLASHFKGMKLG